MKELRKYAYYFLMYSFALTLFSCEQKNYSTEQEPEPVATLPYNIDIRPEKVDSSSHVLS